MNRKIKVLHTEWSDGWGGQEIRIIQEILAVKSAGVDVFLACRDKAVIKERAIEKGITVFLLDFKGNTDIKTFYQLYKIIKKNNIDIVNTHSGKDTWVGGLAAKLAGIKFIRTRHLSIRIGTSRFKFINELADYIFTTGESVKADMIQYNRINPEKIKSIPTGIDENLFDENNYNLRQCRETFNIQRGEVAVGIVAVLRAFKRHDRFISLAKKIIEEGESEKPVRFFIAGDGPQKKILEQKIKSLGMENHIIMLGHVANVPALLKALDIFVLTSDSNEGVPQSIMQALLMNKPVLATNAGSTGDLYHKKNFIMVEKNDMNKMYVELLKLINEENFAAYHSIESRAFIVDNFGMTKMVENITTVYRQIVALL